MVGWTCEKQTATQLECDFNDNSTMTNLLLLLTLTPMATIRCLGAFSKHREHLSMAAVTFLCSENLQAYGSSVAEVHITAFTRYSYKTAEFSSALIKLWNRKICIFMPGVWYKSPYYCESAHNTRAALTHDGLQLVTLLLHAIWLLIGCSLNEHVIHLPIVCRLIRALTSYKTNKLKSQHMFIHTLVMSVQNRLV